MPTPWTVIGWAVTVVDAVPYWLPIATVTLAVVCIRWGRHLEDGALLVPVPAGPGTDLDDEQPGVDTRLLHTCQAIHRAGTANRRNTRRSNP